MSTFKIKKNDTLPALEAQLVNADGTPINLELCAVYLNMDNKVHKIADITDDVNGAVKYNWKQGDTDTTGLYRAEFEINYPDGSTQTVPNDSYFLVQIIDELA